MAIYTTGDQNKRKPPVQQPVMGSPPRPPAGRPPLGLPGVPQAQQPAQPQQHRMDRIAGMSTADLRAPRPPQAQSLTPPNPQPNAPLPIARMDRIAGVAPGSINRTNIVDAQNNRTPVNQFNAGLIQQAMAYQNPNLEKMYDQDRRGLPVTFSGVDAGPEVIGAEFGVDPSAYNRTGVVSLNTGDSTFDVPDYAATDITQRMAFEGAQQNPTARLDRLAAQSPPVDVGPLASSPESRMDRIVPPQPVKDTQQQAQSMMSAATGNAFSPPSFDQGWDGYRSYWEQQANTPPADLLDRYRAEYDRLGTATQGQPLDTYALRRWAADIQNNAQAGLPEGPDRDYYGQQLQGIAGRAFNANVERLGTTTDNPLGTTTVNPATPESEAERLAAEEARNAFRGDPNDSEEDAELRKWEQAAELGVEGAAEQVDRIKYQRYLRENPEASAAETNAQGQYFVNGQGTGMAREGGVTTPIQPEDRVGPTEPFIRNTTTPPTTEPPATDEMDIRLGTGDQPGGRPITRPIGGTTGPVGTTPPVIDRLTPPTPEPPAPPPTTGLNDGMAEFDKSADAVEARIARLREQGTRGIKERLAARGIFGDENSPLYGALGDLETELALQGQERLGDLGRERNQYMLQQEQLKLDQKQVQLQEMGMNKDDAFRYANLSQDARFRQLADDNVKAGMKADEAYRKAEQDFNKVKFDETMKMSREQFNAQNALDRQRFLGQLLELYYGMEIDAEDLPEWAREILGIKET